MRALTGAIFILTAEQAFSHALLISFPHQPFAQTLLFPFAATTMLIGFAFVLVGIFQDQKSK
jgi:hypothetical protein